MATLTVWKFDGPTAADEAVGTPQRRVLGQQSFRNGGLPVPAP
jgi:hypothetical protein